MRVLVATAELAPITAGGGLGEAVAGLVGATRQLGVEVDVALPDYATGRDAVVVDGEIRRALDVPSWAAPAVVRTGDHPVAGRLHLVSAPRVARSHPYLCPDGSAWPDNAARFLAFSRAVAALVRRERPDVVHLNAWHTGAVLAALPPPPQGPGSLLSLHDVVHQGVTDGAWLDRLGPRGGAYEWWGGVNPLAGAIALAGAVVAPSAGNAAEVLTAARGCGLEGVLRSRSAAVHGIRPGIDVLRWDPATDPRLVANFAAGDRAGVAAAKRANRRDVVARVGWPDDGTALAVMLSPLTVRGGADLVPPIVPVLAQVPMRLLVLGAGDAALARRFAGLAADHRDVFAFVEGHDDVLAHRMVAGGDVLLVPSRDDPGGTSPMIAMRYGTIPVVTAVGALRDAVPDADVVDDGNGFVADRVDSVALVSAVFRAARLLADRRRKGALVRRIMALDWSWSEPAAEHVECYRRVARPPATVSSFRGDGR